MADEEYYRLTKYCNDTLDIVRRFVMGEAIPNDTSINRNYVGELLHNYQQKNVFPQLRVGEELPPLCVTQDATGDYKIKALRKFDANERSYAEFQFYEKGFDTILYAPWSRFESSEAANSKHKIASEIARRAMLYPTLLEEIEHKQTIIDSWQASHDEQNRQINALHEQIGKLGGFDPLKI